MKIFILSALVLASSNSFGAPCNGAPGNFHTNPDGSNGGFVQNTAKVAKEVVMDVASEVCDQVIVKGNVRIESGSRIYENVEIQGSALIRDSHLYGYAKIIGSSLVQSSVVCQSSQIEGIKVVNSNYFCQTEDPQPKDPGEAGKKTLLGIDSDADGVRDDVEIWINNKLSNTAKSNRSLDRQWTKILAKILQKELVVKDNHELIVGLSDLKTNVHSCFDVVESENLIAFKYNTEERLLSLIKVNGELHGLPVKVNSDKCKTIIEFNRLLANISKPINVK